MKSKQVGLLVAGLGIAGIAFIAGSLATAEPPKNMKGMPEMKLPKGWTMDDMQACMVAGMPGEHHAFLARGAGNWHGKTTMWMGPGMDAMTSECNSTNTVIMDGRYVKSEMAGDMPGMGPFAGLGIMGFDNVSQKFVSSWLDNHGSGIMQGKGTLSADKKTLTWNFDYNCPITKKSQVMREVDTFTSPNEMTMEMFTNDPKSGEEYKMMRIEFVRKN